jgi:hypothetical protein
MAFCAVGIIAAWPAKQTTRCISGVGVFSTNQIDNIQFCRSCQALSDNSCRLDKTNPIYVANSDKETTEIYAPIDVPPGTAEVPPEMTAGVAPAILLPAISGVA